MSTDNNNNDDDQICGNCGKEGNNLNKCNKCDLVAYCNAVCKKKHRSKHKKKCERRAAELAAELHNEAPFKLPPLNEDCPICMLPLPSLHTGYKYKVCCGKIICSGCIHAVKVRDCGVSLCPFCRAPKPTSDEETIKQCKKRMEVNDATAIHNMGFCYSDGVYGMPQNHAKALELWHQAAELGNAISFCNIGVAYLNGRGVERDEKKAKHYMELGAIGGHLDARHNLGVLEWRAGSMDRALKHYTIAAGCGYTHSLKAIQALFMDGKATKDDYAKALCAYQTNLVEIKSPQRDQAATFDDEYKYY